MGTGCQRDGLASPPKFELCQEPTLPGAHRRDDHIYVRPLLMMEVLSIVGQE
jgi:hypothetical protein